MIAIIPPKVVKLKIIGLVKLQLRKIETNIKVIKLNKIPICGLNIKAMRSTDKLNGIRREGITKILFMKIVSITEIKILPRIITVLGIEEKLFGKKRTRM